MADPSTSVVRLLEQLLDTGGPDDSLCFLGACLGDNKAACNDPTCACKSPTVSVRPWPLADALASQGPFLTEDLQLVVTLKALQAVSGRRSVRPLRALHAEHSCGS